MEQLIPGRIYRLTQDVENPAPDRRQRYDWRVAETIPAGTRFRCRTYDPGYDKTTWQELVIEGGRYGNAITERGSHDYLWVLIVPHLEAEPDTLGMILGEGDATLGDRDATSSDVLCVLLDAGVIDLNHVRLAQRYVTDLDSAEDKREGQSPRWNALRERHGLL